MKSQTSLPHYRTTSNTTGTTKNRTTIAVSMMVVGSICHLLCNSNCNSNCNSREQSSLVPESERQGHRNSQNHPTAEFCSEQSKVFPQFRFRPCVLWPLLHEFQRLPYKMPKLPKISLLVLGLGLAFDDRDSWTQSIMLNRIRIAVVARDAISHNSHCTSLEPIDDHKQQLETIHKHKRNLFYVGPSMIVVLLQFL